VKKAKLIEDNSSLTSHQSTLRITHRKLQSQHQGLNALLILETMPKPPIEVLGFGVEILM
jgi:hypothetical protein